MKGKERKREKIIRAEWIDSEERSRREKKMSKGIIGNEETERR